MKVKLLVLTLITSCFVLQCGADVKAHSGRTDSSGGHNCYVGACAGTYHYHNGGGYSAPSTPTYYDQGITNGKKHAIQEADNIRIRSKQSGYQAGYDIGYHGGTKSYFASAPDSICSMNFTFDAGTNETYKSAYNTGWLSNCNTYASAVYQDSYDQGFAAGEIAKPKPVTKTSDTTNDQNDNPNDGWLGLAFLGFFFGLPIIGAIGGSIRDWWNNN